MALEQSFCIILTLLSLSVLGQFTDEDLMVDAGSLGRIRGTPASTAADNDVRRDYIQFRGIPYASIPQRFLPSKLSEGPLTSDPLREVFNATTNPLSCFQPLLLPSLMTEACLYINIYTHKKFTGNESELRPVVFFIHGGAFTVGTGASFSGLRLLNRDIVYVTFNYRLGLQGFFSLQNEDIPGNSGMYDVINALKWTNKFIRHFGGDPNLVTIAGQSAGSVTVTQLMASPLAEGLFHRAIAASGSALNVWGTTSDPIPDALKVASLAGCHNESRAVDFEAVGNCMRAVDPNTLVSALYTFQVTERQQGRLGFSVVSPVVQNFPMTVYEKFLPEHPRTVFEEGRQASVPLLSGSTKHDGSYVLGVVFNRFLKDNALEDDAVFLKNQLLSTVLRSLGIEDVPTGVHEAIGTAYLGDGRLRGNFSEMFPGLVDIFSVFFFKGDCYTTAKLHSRVNPSYWYSFDFRGHATLYTSLFPGEIPPFPGGVGHTDDLIYLYSLTFSQFTPEESLVSTRMLNYWANFAKFGDPTPPSSQDVLWPRLDESEKRYMVIDDVSFEDVDYVQKWVGPGTELSP